MMAALSQVTDGGFESLPAIVARRAAAPADAWSLTFLAGECQSTRIDLRSFAAMVGAVAAPCRGEQRSR